MIKTVIFDLDGTLLDTLTDLTDSVNFMLSTLDLPLRTREEVCSYVGNGVPKLIERAIGIENQKLYSFALKIFLAHYSNNLANATAPFDGIEEALRELKKKDISLAVVSNKVDSATKTLIEMYFPKVFDFVAGTSDIVRTKPSTDLVDLCLHTLIADKATTIFVGDSDVDVMTARNANLLSVGVAWGFRGGDFLKKVGADFVVDTPKQLVSVICGIGTQTIKI